MKKIIAGILSCLMITAGLCLVPTSNASADTLFNIIMRAAQTMSALQIENNHYMERTPMPTRTSGGSTQPIIIPPPPEKESLKTFAIDSYIEHGSVHKFSDETIHKSNLPLTILTWMSGYGNITGVSVDGVDLASGLVAKIPFDNVNIDTRCMEFVTLDESVINSLSNGNHRIVVTCTGGNGSGSIISYTDDFTFNLAD